MPPLIVKEGFSHTKNQMILIFSIIHTQAGWGGEWVLLSLLLFGAHALVLGVLLVKERALVTANYEKNYQANMENSSLFLALVMVFTKSAPVWDDMDSSCAMSLMKEWTFDFPHFITNELLKLT